MSVTSVNSLENSIDGHYNRVIMASGVNKPLDLEGDGIDHGTDPKTGTPAKINENLTRLIFHKEFEKEKSDLPRI